MLPEGEAILVLKVGVLVRWIAGYWIVVEVDRKPLPARQAFLANPPLFRFVPTRHHVLRIVLAHRGVHVRLLLVFRSRSRYQRSADLLTLDVANRAVEDMDRFGFQKGLKYPIVDIDPQKELGFGL